ncbi:long-chain-fatty-acid--CoA ligase [Brevibacterium sp. BRM-1]|uniref:long-chain-fatty-acid--CoA ligase n=1 Tax=Brevibacterium sp. BRM-1 TaxID=2999062 RepID=UPI0022831FC8|nr:long-chain-fatty-acid--CoA ligase [Brevibacterium sp. BRM-1]WAL40422.1 long-chain-fatty-acid--CoA ligase [Brevibacterium sp. BRM-1]
MVASPAPTHDPAEAGLAADGTIPAALRRGHWMNLLRLHAAVEPDGVAVRFEGADTTWSGLAAAMEAGAAALSRRGVGPGDRVLLLGLNRPEYVEALLAIHALGAIAVPINVRLAPPEIAYIVDDADADLLLADAVFAPAVDAVRGLTGRLREVVWLDAAPEAAAGGGEDAAWPALVAQGTEGFAAPDVAEDATALIMYTSGTTGRPKGAMLDHLNMLAQVRTSQLTSEPPSADDVMYLSAPLFHIAGTANLIAAIVNRVRVVLHPLGTFDPVAVVEAYEREGATTAFNVPQQWQAICAVPGVRERRLRLRTISWGAAPASPTLLRLMAETFPQALIVAAFGQTEMSPVTCVLRGEEALERIGSVGRPIPWIAARVVDPAMEDVAPGEVGEIVYRGPTLMRGYWRRPDATAEAFAGGWFHSGDLVRQDADGYVWVVDRVKDMIISGGENIYCTEVENELFAHPAVLEAAVWGRPDERWGEVPAAGVVLREGHSLGIEELRAWLEGRLAHFKIPRELHIVDALPRNASGKVRKVELRGLTER